MKSEYFLVNRFNKEKSNVMYIYQFVPANSLFHYYWKAEKVLSATVASMSFGFHQVVCFENLRMIFIEQL